MAGGTRAEAIYRGQVQGVGFRYTVQRAAGGFDVGGYVQNLSSGEVRLVAEGPREEVEAFLAAVIEAMGEYVEDVAVNWAAPTGEFRDFRVRF